jgi:hypothetical protein
MDKTEALEKLVDAYEHEQQAEFVSSAHSHLDSAHADLEDAIGFGSPDTDRIGDVHGVIDEQLRALPSAATMRDKASDLRFDVQNAEPAAEWTFQDVYEACETQDQVDAVEAAADDLGETLKAV